MYSITKQTDILIQSLYHEQTCAHVDTSISTNSELIESIKQGILSSGQVHVLTADKQTNGRGQGSRSWQSPKGNVYLSLFYPVKHHQYPLTQPISGLLSLCVGYFLAQLPIIQKINQYRRQRNMPVIGIKWANDIGFYEFSDNNMKYEQISQFYKLSGILIEPVVESGKGLGVVVGVGLNVQNAPLLTKQTQECMNYQSISLTELLPDKQCPTVSSLYQPINQAIFRGILTHQKVLTNEAALQEFLSDFAKTDILRRRRLKVSQNDAEVMGEAVGIDKFGCLQLQADDDRLHSLFTGKIDVIG